ncbi:extracellular solute-binding protein [Paenibacillus flagellatus]|uniref:GntR family transcriptional regulator n=1 Tax=Paenibacillus flagellatus TaxID=2211139 RepID=A0A2V5K3H0_9BACL|nr:extracellular solute-binding protein [Paenibacillus flagellatus]PYI53778.1 GntR family transcriptional regulator [Paenibacillus flagellatus]
MTERISRRTFAERLDQMVRELRGRILDGTYAEGDFLPAESALAMRFRLSNNSVRKGLETLVAEGLIVKIDKVGSRVIPGTARPTTTITIACSPSIARDTDFQRLLDDFHLIHPSIRVAPVAANPAGDALGGTYPEFIRNAVDDESVDLFTVNHMHFRELAESGFLHVAEPLPPDGRMYRFLNEAFAIDGRTYVLPLVFSPVVLCYNKDHFAEAGLPEPDSGWTWDDLVDAAARLTVPGKRHGFHFFQVSENRWPLFVLQGGGTFGERDGDAPIGRSGGEDRLERLLEGVRLCGDILRNRDVFPNYWPESEPEASRLFAEGRISMQLATYHSLNDLKDAGVRYDISPVPNPAGRPPATLLVAIGLLASARTKRKEEVRLFLDYAASRRAQEHIRAHTLSIPAMKAVAESPEPETGAKLNRPARFPLFREIIPSYRLHAQLGLPMRQFEPLRRELMLYWSGMLDEPGLAERLRKL